MKAILSSPDISGVDKLYEIYLSLPDRNKDYTTNIHYFYDFLQTNTVERQKFLDTYCDYEFMPVQNTVILKVSPKK